MNWSDENLIFLIIGAILSIPIGFAVNLLTPKFQNWLARRSYKRAQERIKELNNELNQIKNFTESKIDIVLISFQHIFWFFMFVLFAIGLEIPLKLLLYVNIQLMEPKSIYPIILITTRGAQIIIFFIVLRLVTSVAAKIQKIMDFETYKMETENEKARLAQIKV